MLSMKRSLNWCAVAAVVAIMATTSGCEQSGVAFGDSQGSTTVIRHDQIDRSDVLLGIVGSQNLDGDRIVLDSLADAKLEAAYVSTASSGAGQLEAAQQGVEDLVSRGVNGIMVMALSVDTATESSWQKALGSARSAGVPVILVNPKKPPSDDDLYAATLYTDRQGKQQVGLDAATLSIINDDGHPRIIDVRTDHEQ